MTLIIVNKTLNNLKNKNSSGTEKISSNLLKSTMPFIMNPKCRLFNLWFKSGYIPTLLKIAKIVPMYKTGEMDKFKIIVLSAYSPHPQNF